jgi:diaminobutyrate-2-oxoglutarate transaminase
MWDEDGVEFIDFLSGCGSLNYGHNHPAIKQAAISYLEKDGIGNALDFHTEAKLDFITRFNDVLLKPKRLPHLLQFTGPTGANCVEAALKLARKFTRRYNVAAFTNAFHGMSAGALAVTGAQLARCALEAGLHGVTRLPFEGYCGAGVAELDRFAEMAKDPSGGIDPLAAIIVETVQGEGGLNVASVAWLRKLREISSEIGALLIIDDIQAGCGRTGEFFSFERAGIVPDMICLSKSLSGSGLPMSVLLVAPEFDVWQPGEHNGTFRGNSLAFVTATAALNFWGKPDFVASISQRSKVVDAWTRKMVLAFPDLISRKKGLEMMAGIEFISPKAAQLAVEFARESHILIERCGPKDEVMKVFAPINIDIDLFREGLERLTCAIGHTAEAMPNGARSAAA